MVFKNEPRFVLIRYGDLQTNAHHGGKGFFKLYIYFYFFIFFLGLHLQYMEVPRLGVKFELQLPAYTTATATPDVSHICDLHHSSQQFQILNH